MNMYKRAKYYVTDHVRYVRKTAITGIVVILTAIVLTGCQGIFDDENMENVNPRTGNGMSDQMDFNRRVGNSPYDHVRIPIFGNPY